MKFEKLIFLLIFFLANCDQYAVKQKDNLNELKTLKYKNSGFTLVFNENLDVKNLEERSLDILHASLKKKSLVKITNLINNKSITNLLIKICKEKKSSIKMDLYC